MTGCAISDLLNADTTFAGLVGARIYPVKAPDSRTTPYVTYAVVTNRDETTIDRKVSSEQRWQFDVFGSYSDVHAIEKAMRAVLRGYTGTLSDNTRVIGTARENLIDNFDPYARVNRLVVEYSFTISEP